MQLTFLSGALPLTKTITNINNTLVKDSYPNLLNFTSTTTNPKTIGDFYKDLITHGTKGACLLKGILSQPLDNEPRKGKMPANTPTQWVCFDLDRAPFSTPEEFLRAIKLHDISYVVQYSSSYRLDPKDKTLSAHIFMMLDKVMAPSQLKAWLMHLNLNTPVLEQAITLSSSDSFLHWPLDITTCQNDKLLYTTPPKLVNIKDPLTKRIELVTHGHPHIAHTTIALKSMDELKTKSRNKLNALRAAKGITPLKHKERIVGEYTVQPGVGEATSYERFDEGEYYRYNLNGGDSKAYWHPKNDWEFLHSFKGEPSMYMKDILPEVFKEFNTAQRTNNQTTTNNGTTLLAFREKRTAEYWKGTYEDTPPRLDINKVKDMTMLDHFLQAHGSALGPFVPEYEFIFDPSSDVVIDTDNRQINRFVPTLYMTSPTKGAYPIIQRVLDHAVGTGPIQEHFLNWLACLMQHRTKLLTSWILHGTEGTGKGLLIDIVIKTMLGDYYKQIMASTLKSDFNGWRENMLLIMIDEMEIDMFEEGSMVQSRLKTYITEPTGDINRKGVNQYTISSHENYILSSNKNKPISISQGDRRNNVAHFQPEKLIISVQDATVNIKKEIDGFAHYLMNRKADLNLARSILHTEDRQAIMELSMTSADELGAAIVEGDLEKLFEFMPDERLLNDHGGNPVEYAYASLIRRWVTEESSKITRDELAVVFKHCINTVPEGKNKFTTYLRHHGIRTARIKINDVLAYGIHIGWKINAKVRQELLQSLTPSAKLRRVK